MRPAPAAAGFAAGTVENCMNTIPVPNLYSYKAMSSERECTNYYEYKNFTEVCRSC